jgi:DedD protein
MDRALKERIVGATVLVVIAVLVVPVFLDGPSDEPEIVTESVTLPGQAGQSSKRQTIVLERDREEPVPAGGGAEREAREPAPAAEGRKEQPVAAARPQSPPPESVPQPAQKQASQERPAEKDTPAASSEVRTPAATESATGMWAVQLGSFSNQTNAERLAAELRKQGYAAFLSRVQTSAEVLHRVRVGPQQNRESAEQVAARLGSDGHKGQVVPHP